MGRWGIHGLFLFRSGDGGFAFEECLCALSFDSGNVEVGGGGMEAE